MARIRSSKKTSRPMPFRPQLVHLDERIVPAFVVRSVSADDIAGITPARDAFRVDLGGGTTAGANGSFGGVRREINWDGVPATKSAPNVLPDDFFNTTSPRGVVFDTPSNLGFQVSGNTADAGAGQPDDDFSTINVNYSALFNDFSPQRLFTPVGSNITDVTFFVPGTNIPAAVTGFGAIFSDVDIAGSTSIQFFDANGNTLNTSNAKTSPTAQNGGFSFLGGFDDTGKATIARVRITTGNFAAQIGNDESATEDIVVMDDFLYGEPQAIQQNAFAISGTTLLSFSTSNPTAATKTTITGVTTGETLVSIDVRPQNGLLYALGIDSVADKGTLYTLSPRTGVATPVGPAGAVALVDANTQATIDFLDPATNAYDIDFNPTVDRLRIVTSNGTNFRINPNTGAVVDSSTVANGLNPDAGINGPTTTVGATAYTNNAPNQTVTSQYTIDATTKSLYIQTPPNNGTQTNAVPLTLAGAVPAIDFIAGLDIAGVIVSASGTPTTGGSAFSAITIAGVEQLYAVNLVTGALSAIGKIGDGTLQIDSLAIQPSQGGIPVVALDEPGKNLVRFNTATPAISTTVGISGVDTKETLAAIDFRPQTGQLVGLAINADDDNATIYVIDPQTGVATPVGATGAIALVSTAGAKIDFGNPITTTTYEIDFNPTVDRIRVVGSDGLNFRVNPNTGVAIDGDGTAATGVNPDGVINGESKSVFATAYTNSFGQSLSGGVTTQYTLDATTDKLLVQFPPNDGTQILGVVVTENGKTLDFGDVLGFDIPAGVQVSKSGEVTAGTGFAVLTIGTTDKLYSIDLKTGVATFLANAPTALFSLTLADTPIGVVSLDKATITVAENVGNATLSLTRSGGSSGPVSVTVNLTNGTARDADYTITPVVVTFADGQTTATAAIPITDDKLAEGTESFTVALASPTGGVGLGTTTTATIIITDDDPQATSHVAYALAGNSLLTLDTANPQNALAPVPITGITAGESLVGIDIRPFNGFLYGLGYEPVAGTVQLYAISPRTAVATKIGTIGQFVDAGGANVRIGVDAATKFGIDFNPTVDRIRVVTSSGQNFRINPNTGAFIDGDLGGSAGSVAGINTDGAINGGTTKVDETAYTNNVSATSITTQYTLDASTDKLFIQNAPNAGTQTVPLAVTEGGNPLDFTAVGGFDIPSFVNATSANGTALGFGFATLVVGGVNKLYQIELLTGKATFVNTLRDGTVGINGLAIATTTNDINIRALNSVDGKIVRFSVNDSLNSQFNLFNGVTAGETIVGFDIRPATGQLFGLGIDAANDRGSLYLVDPQTAVLTVIGTAGSIKFVQPDGTTPVDLPLFTLSGYGFDFNPTLDKIRVVTGNGLNFRIDPTTGAPVDGDTTKAGTQTDAAINGAATGAVAAAYTNSFGGANKTTQYVLDPATDKLYIQDTPNSGTLKSALAITVGGAPLDFTDVAGFDIPSGVQVTTSGMAAAGVGYATLFVGGKSQLYSIDLSTGAAKDLGQASSASQPLAGLTLSDVASGVVQFSSTTASVTENGAAAKLTLTRSSAFGTVNVQVSFTDGTANTNDYTIDSINATFADGQTSIDIFVPIINDNLAEGDETFTATITDLTDSSAVGAAKSTLVTIVDDELVPAFTIDDVIVTEGNTGTKIATFTVILSGPSTKELKVDFATADATAKAGADYVAQNGTLTFAAGETTKTISIVVNGDTIDEVDETFTVTLSNAVGGATLGTAKIGTGTITDDDAPPVATINSVSIAEGDTGTKIATFTVTLGVASGREVKIDFATADVTAKAGTDYVSTKGTLTFAPGETTKTISVTISGDTIDEADETFTVTLANPVNATLQDPGKTGTGTITDDDTAPTVTIDNVSVAEGNTGTTTATFTLTLSAASGLPVTVDFATADVTAKAGSDYTTSKGTVTFAAGETTKTVSIVVTGDTIDEADETFTVTLTNPTNATLGTAKVGTGTITDDDPTPTVSIGNVSIAEGNTGTRDVTFTVSLSTASALPVTVKVASSDGTATAGSDYVAFPLTTVTIPAGSTTATVTVAINGDTTVEPDETFKMTLSSPTSATLGTSVATGTIINDDLSVGGRVPLVGTPQFAGGTDTNGKGTVTLFNSDKSVRFTLQPFGEFKGGVRVAVGDFNGDGVNDVAAGTGPGRATQVIVFDGTNQKALFTVNPFEASFTGGVYVAAGDLDGDGKADLIITPDEGGGPRVDVYAGGSFAKSASFFGIDDPNFRGGARANTGDVNGDGRTDLTVAAGFGGGPRVAVFDGTSIGSSKLVKLFNDFFAFEQSLRNGVFITLGDVDGDGKADVVAGGGPGGGPRVTVFSATDLISSGGGKLTQLVNFFAGDVNSRQGIRVAVKDFDNDSRGDLLVGAGDGGRITSYLGKSLVGGATPVNFDFALDSTFNGGVFVG